MSLNIDSWDSLRQVIVGSNFDIDSNSAALASIGTSSSIPGMILEGKNGTSNDNESLNLDTIHEHGVVALDDCQSNDDSSYAPNGLLSIPRQYSISQADGFEDEDEVLLFFKSSLRSSGNDFTGTGRAASVRGWISQFIFQNILGLAAVLASMGGLIYGYDLGVISGALQPLSIYFELSEWYQSIIVSALNLGCVFGSMSGGYLVDMIGRKNSILLVSVFFCSGSFLLYFSSNVYMLILGRFIVGIGVSYSVIADCVYITELSTPSSRGMLVSLNEIAITLGILLAFVAGMVFNGDEGWRMMFLCPGILAFLQGIFVSFLPQSPVFLCTIGKHEEARRSLFLLRAGVGTTAKEMTEEYLDIRSNVMASNSETLLQQYKTSLAVKKASYLNGWIAVFATWTGMLSILFFTPRILEESGFSQDMAPRASVYIGLVKFIAVCVSVMFVDHSGRRPLLLIGGAIGVCGCFLLCIGIKVVSLTSLVHLYQKVLNMLGLFLITIGFSIGYGPVMWILLSEMFPSSIRGRAFSIAYCWNDALKFILTFTFIPLMNKIGVASLFLLYGLAGSFGVYFTYKNVIETRGLSLEQVQERLNRSISSSRRGHYSNINMSDFHIQEEEAS